MIRAIDVQYAGPATLSKERILAQMRTKVGQPYSNEVVQEDIKTLYKTGYIRNVRIFAQPEGDGVKVIVAVQTRAIVHEIEITGAERVKPTRLRKERTEKGPMIITIVISEGPQYHVRNLTITGYQHTTEPKVRTLLKMKEGSVYSPKQLRDDAKAVADAYGSGGYVDLVITPEGTPAGTGLIDVHYTIEESVRSFVNRVNIEGNTRTKDKVIRREVLVAPGDVFNTVRVDTTKKRLENLGYFAKVETYPEDTDIPGRKDLTILVQEKRTGSLSFGGGFSTVDKLVGFAELTQGNFDLFNWPSFTGGGEKFRLRIQYGTERKDALLTITEPYFLDRRLALTGQAFYTEANYLSADYDQRNYGFSLDLRKPINAYMYGTLGYTLQNVEIFNVASSSPEFILTQSGTFTESKMFSSVVLDTRDNPLLSRRGNALRFRLLLPVVFSEAILRFMDWIWKGLSIFICQRTLSCCLTAKLRR